MNKKKDDSLQWKEDRDKLINTLISYIEFKKVRFDLACDSVGLLWIKMLAEIFTENQFDSHVKLVIKTFKEERQEFIEKFGSIDESL